MKSAFLWTLVVLNVALLVSFLSRVMPENRAMAQQPRTGAAAPAARAGDYVLAPAEVLGLSNGIVVVIDQTNGRLGAISYDDANNRFEYMSTVELQASTPAPGGNAPRQGNR